MARKLLGEILREKGKVTPEQVREALNRQLMSDKALGHILFDMGLVTESDVLRAWSEQLGSEVIDLARVEPPAEALEALPRAIAEKHHVFPVAIDASHLTIAMSDPLGKSAVQEISRRCSRKVKTVVSSALGIAQAIQRHYPE